MYVDLIFGCYIIIIFVCNSETYTSTDAYSNVFVINIDDADVITQVIA